MENGRQAGAQIHLNHEKRGPKNDAKTGALARTSLEGRRVWRAPYSLDLNIHNSCLPRL